MIQSSAVDNSVESWLIYTLSQLTVVQQLFCGVNHYVHRSDKRKTMTVICKVTVSKRKW